MNICITIKSTTSGNKMAPHTGSKQPCLTTCVGY